MRHRIIGLAAALVGCTESPIEPFLPDVEAATFVAGVDHPHYPLPVGATWAYEAEADGEVEHIEVEVLAETKEIQGVTAVVVRDTASIDGTIIEDTMDWYAQDDVGNVWYLGEETCAYEGGDCVDTEGSWEWGVDGALPGIVMPAGPAVDGQPYYQEYYVDHAEDVGEVVAVGDSEEVTAGMFDDCVATHDTSTLDHTLLETKHFCAGVGLVLTEEADVDEVLVEYALP